MMITKRKTLIAAISVLALGACERTSFLHEAGVFLDEGQFGNPTLHNRLIMTGQLSYVESLAERFAEEVTPTINFEFNSSVLDQEARAVLRQQATWINQFPEVRFSVYGHTDLVGSNAYNRSLGLRRARAAVAYLVSQGVDRSRLEALVSLGETQPIVATEQRERRNRRTVTEVSGFVQGHPAVLDGQYARIVHRNYVNSGSSEQTVAASGSSSSGSE